LPFKYSIVFLALQMYPVCQTMKQIKVTNIKLGSLLIYNVHLVNIQTRCTEY
jgi:hypothetical protein